MDSLSMANEQAKARTENHGFTMTCGVKISVSTCDSERSLERDSMTGDPPIHRCCVSAYAWGSTESRSLGRSVNWR